MECIKTLILFLTCHKRTQNRYYAFRVLFIFFISQTIPPFTGWENFTVYDLCRQLSQLNQRVSPICVIMFKHFYTPNCLTAHFNFVFILDDLKQSVCWRRNIRLDIIQHCIKSTSSCVRVMDQMFEIEFLWLCMSRTNAGYYIL